LIFSFNTRAGPVNELETMGDPVRRQAAIMKSVVGGLVLCALPLTSAHAAELVQWTVLQAVVRLEIASMDTP
jgi:hypothetical protein